MKQILVFVILFIVCSVKGQNDTVIKDSIPQPDLSFVDVYDSMLIEHFKMLYKFTNDTAELNINDYTSDSVPKFSDDVFKFRIQQLDEKSPFEFVSNDATIAMIKLYAYKRKKLTSRMLAYSELYFPIFEEYLIKYDMPLELKYLPIVESALNPTAKSPAGAGGLWQFMPKTGKIYGLDITSYTDERFDPYLATDAACKYLKFLYSIYNDWSMALAAYNAGPGNVNKAIRRSGGKTTYWEIRPYLFRETQNYVPAFIAANYIMNYASEHNLYPQDPAFLHLEVDTIQVCQRVDFQVIEEWLGYDIGKIKYLNPMYKQNIIPKPEKTSTLYLPAFLAGDFIMYEDTIYKYSSTEYEYYVAANKPKKEEKVHIIRKGESMASLAKKYNCTEEDIKAWNNMSTNYLRPGRKLYVYIPIDPVSKAKEDATKKEVSSGEYTYYTIRQGDTLWDIAQKYDGISVNDLMRINSELNFNNLKTGTKIKIGK